jgi:hypothetical protein
VVSPESFFEFFLGLSDEQIELIKEQQKSAINEERDDFQGEEEE